jgi:type IV pilus assembly protein PilV
MKYRNAMNRRRHMTGITMVESLVALVVIAVGMLGIAGLYLASLKAGRTANLRVQAINLTADMADRIRANKLARAAYGSAQYEGEPASHDCTTVTCTPADMAENDLNDWFETLDVSLRNLNATGTVVFTDNAAPEPDSYVITVSWREAGEDAPNTVTAAVEL